MSFTPGALPPGMTGAPDTQGLSEQEKQMIKYMQAGMESCVAKTVISGVMGAGLGAVFGVFMSSMRYDNPMSAQGAALSALPIRQQLKQGFKEIGRAGYSSAKNFGLIGAIFSGTECAVEGFRGKSDLWNGAVGGCLTGAALAINAGPQAAGVGCIGFAAFSTAIDAYMRMPEDERVKPVV